MPYLTDGRLLSLGKLPAKPDPRRIQLSDLPAMPSAPPNCDWTRGVTEFGMMGNDVLGDCTCAAYGHGAQLVTLNTPTGLRTPPDQLILNLYENACGYVPGNPSTDQGGVITDVLDYVRAHALGHKHLPNFHRKFPLLAYADTIPGHIQHIKNAIYAFCTVNIGLQLPVSAQSQVGKIWDLVGNPQKDPDSKPGSWGGHAVILCAYSPSIVKCITWGQIQSMTWRFWQTYVDEAHALLYKAWLDHFKTKSPELLPVLMKALEAFN